MTDDVIVMYDQLNMRLDQMHSQLIGEIYASSSDEVLARGHVEVLRRLGLLQVDIVELKRRRLVRND